jgi:general secretion pathway protein G
MRAPRGFTLLELAGVAALCSLLAGVLLDRLQAYAGESDCVAEKQLVGTLRTALALRSAQAAAKGGQGALLSVAHEYPVDWLAKRPENYLGEYFSPDEAQLSKGNWYFDKADRTLVYLLAASKSFLRRHRNFLGSR